MPKKVLVTGANGQLGATIKALFSKNEDNITFTFVSKEALDITKAKEVKTFFKNKSFHFCINCAAYTDVEQAEKTPEIAYKVNAEGVKNLAEACKASQTILIHMSTDYVFDGEKTEPNTTEDLPNPINEYGKSKLLGEQYIQNILYQYFIIRTSWLYGEHGNNFVKTMLRLAETRNEIPVVNDQMGTPTYAGDVAELILHIINSNNKNFGLFHYSNEGVASWYDFAEAIFRLSNFSTQVFPVTTANYPTAAKRPLYSVLNSSKLKNQFHIKAPHWRDRLQTVLLNMGNKQ